MKGVVVTSNGPNSFATSGSFTTADGTAGGFGGSFGGGGHSGQLSKEQVLGKLFLKFD